MHITHIGNENYTVIEFYNNIDIYALIRSDFPNIHKCAIFVADTRTTKWTYTSHQGQKQVQTRFYTANDSYHRSVG